MSLVKNWNKMGRVCTKCQTFKPWTEFSQKSSIRYGKVQTDLNKVKQPRCKTCAKEDTGLWRTQQSEERLKDLYFRRLYGMGLDEFETRWNNQKGLCKICSKQLNRVAGNGDSAVVDHCHDSGRVRGLLCNECNRGLGYFRDSQKSLLNAARYLAEQDQSSEGG